MSIEKYGFAIEFLKQKYAELIQPYKKISKELEDIQLAIKALEHLNTSSNISGQPLTIAKGAYDFIKKMDRECTLQEIVEGLKNMGVKSTAKNFSDNVRAVLHRKKEFYRSGEGRWSLTEWKELQ